MRQIYMFQNGAFDFHFDQYPAYKKRAWVNKITAWICALLIMFSINIYGDKVLQAILVITIMLIGLSVFLCLDNSLRALAASLIALPSGETYAEIYQLVPKTVREIRYRKHLYWPGYLVTIPEFESLEKDSDGHRQYFPIKRHKISCVKNIEALKEMIEESKTCHP